MKKLGIVVGVFVALVAAGLIYLNSNLDHLIKVAVEKYGSQATQTDVRLDNVKLSIRSGEGSLSGLTVGNPKGFSSAHVLGLGIVSVALDTHSLTGNGPIVIKEVIIEKPEVNVEATTAGDTNLQALERNLSPGANPATGGNDAKSEGRKIIIDNLYVRNGTVDISHPLLKRELTAPLPTIHLTNIGKNSGGATPAQVADQILASIASSAGRVASSKLAQNVFSGHTGGIGSRLQGLFK